MLQPGGGYQPAGVVVEKQSYATFLIASLTLLVLVPTLVLAAVTFARVSSIDCTVDGPTTIQLQNPGVLAPTPKPDDDPLDGGHDKHDDDDDDAHDEPAHWGYSGAEGPDMWGKLSPAWSTCDSGRQQSPIDIVTADAKAPANADSEITRASFQDVGALAPNSFSDRVTVSHNGHAVKVDGTQSYFSKNNEWYKLLQFHFHTPSEHTINGQYSDAEVHFVHQSATGEYLVIGVMINEAPETVPFLQDVVAKAPMSKAESGSGVPASVSFASALDSLLGAGASAPYYTYPGSFTTPPCTERVTWVVLRDGVGMSLADINKLKGAMGANLRPVQPLNDRSVFFRDIPSA